MRKNLGPQPIWYQMPVAIVAAYGENGIPNAMNAAFIKNGEDNHVIIEMAADRKTVNNILFSKCFTINMVDVNHVAEADYLGMVSGNKVKDKINRAGFHIEKSRFVDAPIITELDFCLECRMIDYNPDTCIMTGNVINVSADERVLDSEGNIDVNKLHPVAYEPVKGIYTYNGEKIAVAFKVGKKYK